MSMRRFNRAWATVVMLLFAAQAFGEPFPSPGTRLLFFDDASLESKENLVQTIHQPTKHPSNPVLKREHPWEGFRVQVYGTMIYDPELDLFKASYMNIPATAADKITVQGQRRPGHATLLSYATSKDGVEWEKPTLNLVDFEGSTANNMIAPDLYNPEGFSVIYEPNDPDPSRRYKGFCWDHGKAPLMMYEGQEIYGEGEDDGMYVTFSEDGIHWKPYEGNPVMRLGSDTGQVVLFDPGIKRYVACGRFGAGGSKVARSESEDFIHWSEPKLVLEPDEKDGANTQFYGISIDLYQGLYIGMLWMFWIDEGRVGRIDFQLCHSHDGIQWIRDPERRVFMPNGPEGAWDSGDMRAACRSVIVDDRVMIYYAGSLAKHGEGGPKRIGMDIGLATLRRDGWFSLDAGSTPGTLVTKPFTHPGTELHANADAQGGSIIAEFIPAEGDSAISAAFKGDALDGTLSVDAVKRSGMRGETVRLKLTLSNAKLYSLWFE